MYIDVVTAAIMRRRTVAEIKLVDVDEAAPGQRRDIRIAFERGKTVVIRFGDEMASCIVYSDVDAAVKIGADQHDVAVGQLSELRVRSVEVETLPDDSAG